MNGDLYVIAGEELVGPYARTLDGRATWNGAVWTDAEAPYDFKEESWFPLYLPDPA